MTELEKKQLLVDMIHAARNGYDDGSLKNLSAKDSTESGLMEILNFLLRNKLNLVLEEETLVKPKPLDWRYSEKDLVSFGTYLLSDERTANIKANKIEGLKLSDRIWNVFDADLSNWKEKEKSQHSEPVSKEAKPKESLTKNDLINIIQKKDIGEIADKIVELIDSTAEMDQLITLLKKQESEGGYNPNAVKKLLNLLS